MPLHVQIKLALEYTIKMEDICLATRGRNVIPAVEAKDFEDACLNYVALLAAIRGHFGDDEYLFAYTIKTHDLIHLSQEAKYLHPHLGWCYSGEDFMQQVKRLAVSACKAVSYSKVVIRVLDKYVVGIFHRLSSAVSWKL